MSKFADQLLADLMGEYRPALQDVPPRPAARRPARPRPVWLAVGAAAIAGAIAGAAGISGVGGATPAFAVTENSKGVVAVIFRGHPRDALLGHYVYPLNVDPSSLEMADINAQLRALHSQAVVVPARPGCPRLGSRTVPFAKDTGKRRLILGSLHGFAFSTVPRLPQDDVLLIYVEGKPGGVQLVHSGDRNIVINSAVIGATVVKAPAPECISL
jgi:hypothetical protein